MVPEASTPVSRDDFKLLSAGMRDFLRLTTVEKLGKVCLQAVQRPLHGVAHPVERVCTALQPQSLQRTGNGAEVSKADEFIALSKRGDTGLIQPEPTTSIRDSTWKEPWLSDGPILQEIIIFVGGLWPMRGLRAQLLSS